MFPLHRFIVERFELIATTVKKMLKCKHLQHLFNFVFSELFNTKLYLLWHIYSHQNRFLKDILIRWPIRFPTQF